MAFCIPPLARRLHRSRVRPGRHDKIEGVRYIDKVIRVDQSPLGNTPSSNPATYTGAFDLIRQLFAELPEAAERRVHGANVQLQRLRADAARHVREAAS